MNHRVYVGVEVVVLRAVGLPIVVPLSPFMLLIVMLLAAIPLRRRGCRSRDAESRRDVQRRAAETPRGAHRRCAAADRRAIHLRAADDCRTDHRRAAGDRRAAQTQI